MNKFVRCAIMKRSKLKNKANKTKHPIDIKMYNKQRNYVVGLNKQPKNKYFNNMDYKKDTKSFWGNANPTSLINIKEETLK